MYVDYALAFSDCFAQLCLLKQAGAQACQGLVGMSLLRWFSYKS